VTGGGSVPDARTAALVVIYDIRGFTAASRRIGAAALRAFADAAHQTVLGAFADRPPTFAKNLGDGHLLLWEMPRGPDPDAVADVVERTERARRALAAFVEGRREDGAAVPRRLGFGVAFGEVSRGEDWYGEAINRASRLQNLARPEGLALDRTVYDAAARPDRPPPVQLRRMRVRLKGLGPTRVFVGRPFSWARLGLRVGAVATALLLPLGYVALADAGTAVPGGEAIRARIDRHEASVFRPVRSDAEVRAAADRARRTIAASLLAARRPDGAIRGDLRNPDEEGVDVWGSSQAIFALLSAPETPPADARSVVPGLELLFTPEHYVERDGRAFGWVPHPKSPYTEAEPALWTVAALAAALRRPGLVEAERRPVLEEMLSRAQRAADAYRPLDTGGWNMFPEQDRPEYASPYSTALALLALLETRAAGLGWHGDRDARDRLLRATAAFLAARFEPGGLHPGWRGTPEASDPVSPGLTLQAFATLLRAEAEAGVAVPDAIAAEVPRALARLARRGPDALREALDDYNTAEFNVAFKNVRGEPDRRQEAINLLWHPWAIEAAVRWLARPRGEGVPREQEVEVRRALGLLVADVGDDAARIATSGYTFVASETLVGLSAVPPP
jgi:class 3 adenylate cyclase